MSIDCDNVTIDQDAFRKVARRTKLAAFMRDVWHIIEPGVSLVWNWHLDAFCEHLEAMLFGELKELLVIVPPGTTKSRLFCAIFPAYAWIHNPSLRFLIISNSHDNAVKDSTPCRKIVESDWYRREFAPAWKLAADQNAKDWFETTQGGHRQSLGIQSDVTGKKGDFVIVDDANDASNTITEQTNINAKYDASIWDRVNRFETGRRLVLGQRTGENDLIGHIKRKYKWEEVYIPEEFKPARKCRTSIGWEDPRKMPGQLLRPHEFTRKMTEDYKRTRLMEFNCKHNGEPRNLAGVRFKTGNLRTWRRDGDYWVLNRPGEAADRRFLPKQIKRRFGVADGAASAKTGADFTVISSFIVSPWNDLIWVGCKRFQAEIPDQPRHVLKEYRKHQMDFIGIEATASNVALYQFSSREAVAVRKFVAKGDKLSRATPAIVFSEAHRLYLPDTDEALDFPTLEVLEELAAFTGDEKKDDHDDIVDTLAYGVRYLLGEYPDVMPRPTTQSGVGGGLAYGPERKPNGPTRIDPKAKAVGIGPKKAGGGPLFQPFQP